MREPPDCGFSLARKFTLSGALYPFILSRAQYSNGQRIYSAYCEFCHGEKGKGDGPMVEHLQVQPADLTQIKKKKTDEFPFWQVYQIIDGQNDEEETIKGHGRRAMPIWGQVFERQKDASDPFVQEEIIIGRLLSLVHYLESIQEQ